MKKVLRIILKWIWRVIRFFLIIIILPFVIYLISWSYHRIHASFLSEESKWEHDLKNFEEALLSKHVQPNWAAADVSDRISNDLDDLKQVVNDRGDKVDRDSIRVAMMKISARLQDGHTHIANYSDQTGDIPVEIEFFKDGLYILSADSSIADIVGWKIIGIDAFTIEEVLKEVYTICPASNENGNKMFAEIYLKRPGILYGLGLSKSKELVTFQLKNALGEKREVALDGFSETKGMVSLVNQSTGKISLHRKNPKLPYWYEYDEHKKLLYMKYNSVISIGNDPMDAFIDRMMGLVDSVDIDKFIIDIRNNGGGDNFFTIRLVTEIQKCPKINKKGVLYVINGHQTFSAAICFAGNLSTKTQATFVGTEYADRNNLPGDAKFFDFHMNRMTWQVSELFWENTYYQDQNTTIAPDIRYELSFSEVQNGENPIIDLILNDSLRDEENWIKPDSIFMGYQGRYQFSPSRTLSLDLEKGKVSISGLMQADLYQLSDSVFSAGNLRFNLMLTNGQLKLMKRAQERELLKLDEISFTALELIELERYEEAREAYLNLQATYGNDLVAIAANNLSTTASYLYHASGNNRMQMELLKIALELEPQSMMTLGRMSSAKSIEGEKLSAIGYRIRSLWYFDWKNIDNYGKAFGFF